VRFGIHAGPQDCSIDELRRLWRFAEERGFHWCSVWDHLFSVSDLSNPAKPAFEGIAAMAALGSDASSSVSATGPRACSRRPRSRSIT
jgi:alkanesulfonate monooxygenase SsuD/methylene tetrahydromethanopterin reductase-like flavin-dependent oxidoreductase (luciferase family)